MLSRPFPIIPRARIWCTISLRVNPNIRAVCARGNLAHFLVHAVTTTTTTKPCKNVSGRGKGEEGEERGRMSATFLDRVRRGGHMSDSRRASLHSTELCKIIPAKLRDFLQIFPKMADWQVKAGLSSLAAQRRENSNMEESFYTTLYNDTWC